VYTLTCRCGVARDRISPLRVPRLGDLQVAPVLCAARSRGQRAAAGGARPRTAPLLAWGPPGGGEACGGCRVTEGAARTPPLLLLLRLHRSGSKDLHPWNSHIMASANCAVPPRAKVGNHK
jgi:hypothetical protein